LPERYSSDCLIAPRRSGESALYPLGMPVGSGSVFCLKQAQTGSFECFSSANSPSLCIFTTHYSGWGSFLADAQIQRRFKLSCRAKVAALQIHKVDDAD
jgi:hypothetical protein